MRHLTDVQAPGFPPCITFGLWRLAKRQMATPCHQNTCAIDVQSKAFLMSESQLFCRPAKPDSTTASTTRLAVGVCGRKRYKNSSHVDPGPTATEVKTDLDAPEKNKATASRTLNVD